jgi:K+-transporting ATPase ATPase A chain
MWILPLLVLALAIAVSIPLSRYMAWIMDGRYRPRPGLRWFEARLDSGPQDWKQYTLALLVFNGLLFIYGFVVLSLQPRSTRACSWPDRWWAARRNTWGARSVRAR